MAVVFKLAQAQSKLGLFYSCASQYICTEGQEGYSQLLRKSY
jgi:hypothetical protein